MMDEKELNALRHAMYEIALGLAVAEQAGRKQGTKTVKACPRCGAADGDRHGGVVMKGAILHTPKCEIGRASRRVADILEALGPARIAK